MGTIYHFEPITLPYPDEIYTAPSGTIYNDYTANNKANIDAILGSDKKLVTCTVAFPDSIEFYSIRYVINGDCYGGAFITYVDNPDYEVQEPILNWRFYFPGSGLRSELHIADLNPTGSTITRTWALTASANGSTQWPRETFVDTYPDEAAVLSALESYRKRPITYRLTNCTAPSAPTEAVVGSTVNVPLQFTAGYGIVNPSSDIYVTNNGVAVPSQYSDGVLTFSMPDPS